MATYTGGIGIKAKLNIDNKDLEKEILKKMDNIIAKEVRKAEKIGKQTLKKLREEITIAWFGEYNSDSLIDAIVYEDPVVAQKKDKIVITFNSYVNNDKYTDKPSLERWKDKYKVDLDPKNFVLDLQFNEGIIGLPKEWEHPNPRLGGVTTNPYFIQRNNGLQEELEKQLKKKWQKEVQKAFNAET